MGPDKQTKTPIEVELAPSHPVEPKASLENLLDAITPSNRHSETNWGSPVGRELW